MAHINFLEPPKFSLRQFNLKNFELNYFWLMVIAGGILILMIFYGIVQRYRIGALNESVVALRAEVKKIRGVSSAKPGATQSSLLAALHNRVAWSPIINAVANKTPNTIALNHLKGNAVTRVVDIEGLCADVSSATRYEDALATVPLFSKVMLQSSSAKEAASDSAKKDGEEKVERATKDSVLFNILGQLK